MKLVNKNYENDRDFLFDNLKAILIVLVVMGHALESVYDQSAIFANLSNFIYLFHMPAFIFISGYFSKNPDKCREKAVENILIPYVIFCVLFQVQARILNIGIGNEMAFRIMTPQFGMWYLLALFWWRYFLKDLIRIRFILPFSLVLGVMIGFSREFGSYLSLSRTFGFLFFFLLGYYCTPKVIEKIRQFPKILGILSVLITVIFAWVMTNTDMKKRFLFFKEPYGGDIEIKQAFIRFAVYIIGTIMIFALFNLCSSRKNRFTYIGVNSMSVYIIHLFLIKIIRRFCDFSILPVYVNFILIIIITLGISFITSNSFFTKMIKKLNGWVANLVLKKKEE